MYVSVLPGSTVRIVDSIAVPEVNEISIPLTSVSRSSRVTSKVTFPIFSTSIVY